MDTDNNAPFPELQGFGAATVHEALGRRGALDHAIKPLDRKMSVIGRAVTVDTAPGDNLTIHYAASIAEPGDVLVVDAKGYEAAGPWGDVLTFYAQLRGIAGLVIDGAVRDSLQIVELGFPVFCRAVCIKGTDKLNFGRVNEPIVCGGVAVNPGDAVVGDADGVTVVPHEAVADVAAAAARREQAERDMRSAVREGASLLDILDLRATLQRALPANPPGRPETKRS